MTKTKECREKKKKDFYPFLFLENSRPLSPLREPQTLSLPWEVRTSYQSVSCSVMPDSLQPHGLQPTRILCPWDFPGKDSGVGCHFLLQGIFPTQTSNLCPLRWQEASLPLDRGSPVRVPTTCSCSVTKSCPTLCGPKDYSTPCFPGLHHFPLCSNSWPLSQFSLVVDANVQEPVRAWAWETVCQFEPANHVSSDQGSHITA